MAKLWRDGCLRTEAAGGGPREGRLLPVVLRRASVVRAERLGERETGLDRTLQLVVGAFERRGAAAGAPATLEREEDVGAVREAGRFAGRVGDLGRGLTKAVVDGCGTFFAA